MKEAAEKKQLKKSRYIIPIYRPMNMFRTGNRMYSGTESIYTGAMTGLTEKCSA